MNTELKSFLEEQLGKQNADLQSFIATFSKKYEDLAEDHKELALRIHHEMFSRGDGSVSAGRKFTESAQFKSMLAAGARDSGAVNIGALLPSQKSITGDSVQVGTQRLPQIVPGVSVPLRVRDLLTISTTTAGLIDYVRELSYDNQATSIYSPTPSPHWENITKPESNIVFQNVSERVLTLAHWLAASKQILADVGQMQSFIDGRLLYGLMSVEENQILNGGGEAVGQLNGIATQATAYDANLDQQGDTRIDKVLRAILQVSLAGGEADGIVLHPTDWAILQTLKDGVTGSYVLPGGPSRSGVPMLWGRPVVESHSMSVGEFLVGAFRRGASLFQREDATVEASQSHSDFFTRNMVAIRCEERVALAVFRPDWFVHGQF